jgi:hypothetical protein
MAGHSDTRIELIAAITTDMARWWQLQPRCAMLPAGDR